MYKYSQLISSIDNFYKISSMRLYSIILTASTVSVKALKEKYPELSSQIDYLINKGVKPKYLDWIVSQLLKGESQEELVNSINLFDRKSQALAAEYRDISKFKSLEELNKVLKDLENKVRRTVEVKDESAKKLFENERYVLIRPDTHLAACSFGSGTRWCITSQEVPHYENYINHNTVIYYLIDKTLPSQNILYKVAFAAKRDLDNKVLKIEAFDAADKIYKPEDMPGYNLVKEIIIKDAEAFPTGAVVYAKEGLLSIEEFNHFMSVAISVGHPFNLDEFPEKYQQVKKQVDIVSYIMEHDIQYNQKLQAYKYLDYEFMRALVKEETNPRILSILANDAYIKQYVAGNNNTPPEVLALLAKDNYALVRENVAGNNNTPPEVLALLAKDNDITVRENVAKNNNTPPEVLALLAKDNDITVRENVAKNNNTPKEIFALLSKDHNERVRQRVAGNNNTPKEILYLLVKDNEYVREHVALNNNTPQEILGLLAKDNSRYIRQGVAENNNTSQKILALLAIDNDVLVRENVASNNNTSPETLALLAKDYDDGVRQHVAKNNNTSAETLFLLAKDDDKVVRQNVAKNNNTHPETLSLLTKGSDVVVRRLVAKNNNTSPETLSLLYKDNDVFVRENVASNNNTSTEILALLAKDSDKYVRKNVAKNNNTPQETLALLAKDSDKGVRQAVTKNKNVTPEILSLIDEYEADRRKRILPTREFPKKEIEFDNNYIINVGTEEQRLKFIDSNPPINDLKLLAKHFNISYKVQLRLLDLNNDEINEILLNNYTVDPEIKKIILSGRDYKT